MRRIWEFFGDAKKSNDNNDDTDDDGKTTRTRASQEIPRATSDGRRKKKVEQKKNDSTGPAKKNSGKKVRKARSKSVMSKYEDVSKVVKIEKSVEERERLKTEATEADESPPVRRRKDERPKREVESRSTMMKIAEAKDDNKADDEEFENEGTASMARSKIKTRSLNWKVIDETAALQSAFGKVNETKDLSKVEKSETKSVAKQDEPRKEEEEKKGEATPKSESKPPDESRPQTEVSIMQRMPAEKKKEADKKEQNTQHPERKKRTKASAAVSPQFSFVSRSKTKSGEKQRDKKKDRDDSCSTSSSIRTDPEEATDGSPKGPVKKEEKKEEQAAEDLLPKFERDSRDVKQSKRLMEMIKRNNMLENVLFPAQNETLRAHFCSGKKGMEKKVMDLLLKAADFVLHTIMFRGEDLDENIDNSLRGFILTKAKARVMVVEHLLKNPLYLPQSWGGTTVVLMKSHEEITVNIEDKKA